MQTVLNKSEIKSDKYTLRFVRGFDRFGSEIVQFEYKPAGGDVVRGIATSLTAMFLGLEKSF